MAVLFGGGLLASPGLSLSSFALVFGIFALASSAATLLAAANSPARSLRVRAVIDLAMGVLLCARTPWSALTPLNYLAGAWATSTGILEMFAAGAFHRDRPTEWLEAGAGAIAVALGVFLGVYPETSLPPLVRWIGVAMLASGLLLLVAAGRLKKEL